MKCQFNQKNETYSFSQNRNLIFVTVTSFHEAELDLKI